MQLATNGNDERFEAGPEAPKGAKCAQSGYLRGGRREHPSRWLLASLTTSGPLRNY